MGTPRPLKVNPSRALSFRFFIDIPQTTAEAKSYIVVFSVVAIDVMNVSSAKWLLNFIVEI